METLSPVLLGRQAKSFWSRSRSAKGARLLYTNRRPRRTPLFRPQFFACYDYDAKALPPFFN
jgi:hypothetical protein